MAWEMALNDSYADDSAASAAILSRAVAVDQARVLSGFVEAVQVRETPVVRIEQGSGAQAGVRTLHDDFVRWGESVRSEKLQERVALAAVSASGP
jgi:hypothetical protein